MPNRLENPSGIEPVDPVQGSSFDCGCVFPRSQAVEYFSLVEPIDSLSKHVAVGIAIDSG